VIAIWGTSVTLTVAHNEWLNTLVTLGITGFTAYTGLFISAFIKGMKCYKEQKLIIIIPMAIASYSAHNCFCYQQVVCTPIIIIAIAILASYLRKQVRD